MERYLGKDEVRSEKSKRKAEKTENRKEDNTEIERLKVLWKKEN